MYNENDSKGFLPASGQVLLDTQLSKCSTSLPLEWDDEMTHLPHLFWDGLSSLMSSAFLKLKQHSQ